MLLILKIYNDHTFNKTIDCIFISIFSRLNISYFQYINKIKVALRHILT